MDDALTHGFKAMTAALEKRRFGATDRPRKQSTPARGRHFPNAIKRQIWQRDEGRCTFVAESGRRCERRGDVEFDHIEPLARGGKSTVENLRLLCRAHNQHEAERTFGAGFMHAKRERAKRVAEHKREARAAPVALPQVPAQASARRPAPKAHPPPSATPTTSSLACAASVSESTKRGRPPPTATRWATPRSRSACVPRCRSWPRRRG